MPRAIIHHIVRETKIDFDLNRGQLTITWMLLSDIRIIKYQNLLYKLLLQPKNFNKIESFLNILAMVMIRRL